MSTIENIVKSLAYATEHNQGLHLTHEEVPALNARIAELETENAALKAEISKLKAPQGWIDVKKQMPDVPIALVAWKDGSIKLDSTFTDGGRDYWYHSGLDNVAYWMPLPESPIVYGKACIDQLTAHDATERQDDKSPNDTQTQTIVYGKEREE